MNGYIIGLWDPIVSIIISCIRDLENIVFIIVINNLQMITLHW